MTQIKQKFNKNQCVWVKLNSVTDNNFKFKQYPSWPGKIIECLDEFANVKLFNLDSETITLNTSFLISTKDQKLFQELKSTGIRSNFRVEFMEALNEFYREIDNYQDSSDDLDENDDLDELPTLDSALSTSVKRQRSEMMDDALTGKKSKIIDLTLKSSSNVQKQDQRSIVSSVVSSSKTTNNSLSNQQTEIPVGELVLARWKSQQTYYPAIILKVNKNVMDQVVSYKIQYCDNAIADINRRKIKCQHDSDFYTVDLASDVIKQYLEVDRNYNDDDLMELIRDLQSFMIELSQGKVQSKRYIAFTTSPAKRTDLYNHVGRGKFTPTEFEFIKKQLKHIYTSQVVPSIDNPELTGLAQHSFFQVVIVPECTIRLIQKQKFINDQEEISWEQAEEEMLQEDWVSRVLSLREAGQMCFNNDLNGIN